MSIHFNMHLTSSRGTGGYNFLKPHNLRGTTSEKSVLSKTQPFEFNEESYSYLSGCGAINIYLYMLISLYLKSIYFANELHTLM